MKVIIIDPTTGAETDITEALAEPIAIAWAPQPAYSEEDLARMSDAFARGARAGFKFRYRVTQINRRAIMRLGWLPGGRSAARKRHRKALKRRGVL